MHDSAPDPASTEPPPDIAIDAAVIAPELGLDVPTFRALMADGHVSVLCERGVGDDAGRYRATFYYRDARVRLTVDAAGRVLDADPATPAPGTR